MNRALTRRAVVVAEVVVAGVLVAAAVHCGARSEARRCARNLLRKDKSLTVAVARDAWPFRQAFMERLCDGLAVAGVPVA